MLKPEECAEKFLEHLLENKQSFIINIYGNDDLKVSTKYVNNFVEKNCLPNGLWRKASYRSRFYKRLKVLLRQLGYEMRIEGNGKVKRLIITKTPLPSVKVSPVQKRRIELLRRLRNALNLSSRVDNSLV
jgi:hypothetical protein